MLSRKRRHDFVVSALCCALSVLCCALVVEGVLAWVLAWVLVGALVGLWIAAALLWVLVGAAGDERWTPFRGWLAGS